MALIGNARRRQVYRGPRRPRIGREAHSSPLQRVEPVVGGHHAGRPWQGGPAPVVPVVVHRHVRRVREVRRACSVAVQGVAKVELVVGTLASLLHLVSEPVSHTADHVGQLPVPSSS